MYISSLSLCKNDVCVYVCLKKIDKIKRKKVVPYYLLLL